MNYQVLYRRFRPKSFSEVYGQEHIVTILKNQIMSNMISHAYLFSGPRGTGKTTIAKIFAQAVNCAGPREGESCGACESCLSTANNSLSDVIEIDAASNRGIDEIRDLKDKVNFLPLIGRYRVYIIDEVHMLTPEAFNALLKTLEEPPEHIIFIFATTEAGKVPATILSRCQRFDFARISHSEIIARLKDVSVQLNLSYEEAALRLIAERSDGALRDALSMLDKSIAIKRQEVLSVEDAQNALGIAGSDDIIKIAEAVIDNSASDALSSLDEAIKGGSDVNSIFTQLIDYFRGLMIYANTDKPERILIKSARQMQSYQNNAPKVKIPMQTAFIKELSRVKNESKYLPDPRYLLECCIVQLSDSLLILDSYSIEARLEKLEKKFSSIKLAENTQKHAKQPEPVTAQYETESEPQPEVKPHSSPSFKPKKIKADKQTIDKFQKEVTQCGKFIQNRDRNIILGGLFPQLKVLDFDGETLYLCPTGEAVHMMDIFESKNGTEKLSQILSERLNLQINVSISDKLNENEAQNDILGKVKDVFGDIVEFTES